MVKNESRPGRNRTRDQGIMSQHVTPENQRENTHSQDCAARGAAVGMENGPIDADLRTIIERWAGLPEPVKAGIVAMVRAAGG